MFVTLDHDEKHASARADRFLSNLELGLQSSPTQAPGIPRAYRSPQAKPDEQRAIKRQRTVGSQGTPVPPTRWADASSLESTVFGPEYEPFDMSNMRLFSVSPHRSPVEPDESVKSLKENSPYDPIVLRLFRHRRNCWVNRMTRRTAMDIVDMLEAQAISGDKMEVDAC